MSYNDDPTHLKFPGRRSNGQFGKGRTGNPKGRPRRVSDMDEVMKAMLTSKVPVIIDGVSRVITVAEAMALRVKQEALTGPIRGLERGIAAAERYFKQPVRIPAEHDLSKLNRRELETYGYLAARLSDYDVDRLNLHPEIIGFFRQANDLANEPPSGNDTEDQFPPVSK